MSPDFQAGRGDTARASAPATDPHKPSDINAPFRQDLLDWTPAEGLTGLDEGASGLWSTWNPGSSPRPIQGLLEFRSVIIM